MTRAITFKLPHLRLALSLAPSDGAWPDASEPETHWQAENRESESLFRLCRRDARAQVAGRGPRPGPASRSNLKSRVRPGTVTVAVTRAQAHWQARRLGSFRLGAGWAGPGGTVADLQRRRRARRTRGSFAGSYPGIHRLGGRHPAAGLRVTGLGCRAAAGWRPRPGPPQTLTTGNIRVLLEVRQAHRRSPRVVGPGAALRCRRRAAARGTAGAARRAG